MSVFVDTGVFYAHHDVDATRHDVATEALARVLGSEAYGHVLTSEYIYDETVTLTYRRTGRMEDAIEVGRRIRGEGYPDAIELLHSSPRLFEDAIATYERYTEHGFSFTDAMTVALVERHGIDSVLSFDDDFDGVVDRLVPETVASAQ
ncbi:PIN domain-containing protein [Halalkaliarchaeum sp. AArc-GB]|uniref:type II toxin-antitoxin system VapC family toxin n=1 Tax=Halalkaliarchaeum sp. AArc-GB TaxID=3074078 RepID=UPI002863251B|nr:PIN domain-containing protein [Halalkaliarchaeum sp. AArc-GB]MDR5674260.1 PIN domain-containing protein [Halalkaliarchaeum sp. AArc-GB]